MPAFSKETLEKFKNSQATLADLFGLDARQVAALMTTGHTLWQQGQLEKAKNLFTGLALLDPANPYFHIVIASIHQKQEKYDAAIQRYNWALQIFPNDMNSLTNRGECHLNLGKFQDAAADLKKSIELDPGKKHPASARARILFLSAHEALKLVKESGPEALAEARKKITAE